MRAYVEPPSPIISVLEAAFTALIDAGFRPTPGGKLEVSYKQPTKNAPEGFYRLTLDARASGDVRLSFWDDLGAETVREHRREPDTGNVDDGLSLRDRDVYARELAEDEQPREDA